MDGCRQRQGLWPFILRCREKRYTALLNGDNGDIKCGTEIIPVKGLKPADINTIAKAINTAYEKKYLVKSYNKKWVDGLCEPERVARTMEFVPV